MFCQDFERPYIFLQSGNPGLKEGESSEVRDAKSMYYKRVLILAGCCWFVESEEPGEKR